MGSPWSLNFNICSFWSLRCKEGIRAQRKKSSFVYSAQTATLNTCAEYLKSTVVFKTHLQGIPILASVKKLHETWPKTSAVSQSRPFALRPWDQLSWTVQGAKNAKVVASIPAWALHASAGLGAPCGSLLTQNILWYHPCDRDLQAPAGKSAN